MCILIRQLFDGNIKIITMTLMKLYTSVDVTYNETEVYTALY